MAYDFVRYSPDMETFDPNLEELMGMIIDFWEKTVSESPTGRAPPGGPSAAPMRKRLASSGQKSRCWVMRRR
jgi:hypothetical protein